ncbi:CYTH and CHAD domain-containing protein [Nocardioides sp. GXZ039]|uniref:CYTH and CHAD domain-containing protein n=1 Tax=Nocardioides sp. GXZ039 TaxID=3136018 RepID=UPI0030F3F214
MSAHLEVERAYAIEVGEELPDLSAVPGVVTIGPPRTTVLVARYFDTDDLALVRHGVSLRRRTGGPDEGWHLKVPAAIGRVEVHHRLGKRDDVVPVGLARQVRGWSRGRELRPVAEIETERTTFDLRDADGVVVAEVADDRVAGRVLPPPDAAEGSAGDAGWRRWREVEVELVGAAPEFLDDVDRLLAEHGIEPRAEQRKVGSVLADRLGAVPSPGRLGPMRPASRVLHRRLQDQLDALLRADFDARRGAPDGVHRLRVVCRRLRGALVTFRPLFDRAVTDPIRAELRWVARSLGASRDVEVAQERLPGLVDRLPADQVHGPVRRRLTRARAEGRRATATAALEVLDSPRYLRLLARLEQLAADPPWTAKAERPAGRVLLRRLHRDRDRLRARVVAAAEIEAAEGPGSRLDAARHDVRKAAKRLRYAGETLKPLGDRDAKALRRDAKRLTQLLGERQDTALTRAELRRLAAEASAAGESAFTYGVLHAREEARAAQLESEAAAVWEELDQDPD